MSKIRFETKTASEEEICSHLEACKDDFIPPLDQTVDIQEYSRKIFDRSVTFEAWEDRNLVGLLAAYFNDMRNRTGYVTNVSLMKDHTGLGIASTLVSMCIAYAKRCDFKEITLEVNKENSLAIRLYGKFGFVECENRNEVMLLKLDLGKL